MIPPKAIFVISVLISGLIFSPSYSFAQSNQDDNPLSSLFEAFMKLFSFDDEPSEPVIEFEDAVVVQSSSSTPVANAGGNQTVMQFDKVTLDGSSSTDPDGDTISFHWNQTEGPPVDLSDDSVVNPMFNVTLSGVLKFILTVVDTSNDTGVADVYITVIENTLPPKSTDPPTDPATDGNGKEKVTICHIPPGNPDNAHTITVGEPAVLTHMTKHGDTIGPCSNSPQNEKSNSGKGNNDDENKQDNSGKGNSDKEKNEKSNSGKGNDHEDENEDKKDNSSKGNSGIDNSGKGNQNKDKENKSNSKLKNNNDDEAKDEDIEHEEEHDDEDEDEHEDEDDDEDDDDDDDEDEDD